MKNTIKNRENRISNIEEDIKYLVIKSRPHSPDKAQHKTWLSCRKIGSMVATRILKETSTSFAKPHLRRDASTMLKSAP